MRDVGGVPGLHLATEVFSEAAERAFFDVTGPPDPGAVKRVRRAARARGRVRGRARGGAAGRAR